MFLVSTSRRQAIFVSSGCVESQATNHPGRQDAPAARDILTLSKRAVKVGRYGRRAE
ncbi:uncharacterized protein BCR38DRAFT_427690 [Pseudomassariella vexata]|uniref:Uncharacterized protein n=1 Tax=Pseudomassariella vexata TaxID=1141098 RepID=A0A1Y2E9S5_9PEZI|nr:uncharacterized protein BCR38DRAFT_427690 [Pseudomassariella vexata]ORY67615.1 hypothetical protein BCR38DRAFT_427690 [Pseudomassariella vexata]